MARQRISMDPSELISIVNELADYDTDVRHIVEEVVRVGLQPYKDGRMGVDEAVAGYVMPLMERLDAMNIRGRDIMIADAYAESDPEKLAGLIRNPTAEFIDFINNSPSKIPNEPVVMPVDLIDVKDLSPNAKKSELENS